MRQTRDAQKHTHRKRVTFPHAVVAYTAPTLNELVKADIAILIITVAYKLAWQSMAVIGYTVVVRSPLP